MGKSIIDVITFSSLEEATGEIPYNMLNDYMFRAVLIIAWIVSAILSSKYIFVNKRFKFVLVTLWLALFGVIITLALI